MIDILVQEISYTGTNRHRFRIPVPIDIDPLGMEASLWPMYWLEYPGKPSKHSESVISRGGYRELLRIRVKNGAPRATGDSSQKRPAGRSFALIPQGSILAHEISLLNHEPSDITVFAEISIRDTLVVYSTLQIHITNPKPNQHKL